jgi:hypothetical protein
MHSHLDIQVNGKSLVIPDDSSLPIEEKNPMFNDVSFFSYPIKIPVEGNREVLKNIAHRDSDMRAMDLEHADARIFADGLPLNHGQVITQDGSEIKDSFDFNIDAQQQSFSELIGDLECRDVDISSKHIVIGEKIGRITCSGSVTAITRWKEYDFNGQLYRSGDSQNFSAPFTDLTIESPQALGFSFPGRTQGFPAAQKDADGNIKVTESFINVTEPYPNKPYCNARVAYAHPDRVADGTDANGQTIWKTEGTVKGNNHGSDPRDYGQYWVLDADRQQSGICFYIMYFLDCLFEQLGVIFIKDELLAIDDFSRLCFFTTKCCFDEEDTDKVLVGEQINEWLSSRNCGGQLELRVYTGHTKNNDEQFFNAQEWRELEEDYPVNEGIDEQFAESRNYMTNYKVYYNRMLSSTCSYSAKVYDMIANSDNFPDAAVSSVISSLENSFGIRFLYDPEKKTVTARLIRNIYKGKTVHEFKGKVLTVTPLNEKITGIRMMYSAESDKKEQKNNVRYGVKDYDTDYDYIEFSENRTITNLTYQQMVTQQGLISTTNRNVYIDRTTGDVYRIKVNSEAEDLSSLKPVLFRVGQFKGIEEGDCSERNKDYVQEWVSDFQPLVQNIVNAQDYNSDKNGLVAPLFAPFLDVEMEHEFLEKKINVVAHDFGKIPYIWSLLSYEWLGFYEDLQLMLRETLTLAENYDPTQTDGGNSPLQDIDWGLTIAIMRGGGNDAGLEIFDTNYDGFGNDKWRQAVGTYAVSSDSVTPKGELFDYNGQDPGFGGIHFSLLIRAWVWPEWSDAPIVVSDAEIKDRGLYDTFMRPHAYFILHRKKYKIEVQATIAQLLDIRNHWTDRYSIDGKVGWINAIKYNIEKATGVTDAELEFYAL